MKQYLWKERNLFGNQELLYAAGAVIAAFNLCEISMLSLLQSFIKQPIGEAQRRFQALNNYKRAELIRTCLQEEQDGTIKNLVITYLTHYGISADNRNLIAHSMVSRNFENEGFSLRKFTKNGVMDLGPNVYDVSEDEMLEIVCKEKKVAIF